MTFRAFHCAEPLANALTGDALDPAAKTTGSKHSAVTVEPTADGEAEATGESDAAAGDD